MNFTRQEAPAEVILSWKAKFLLFENIWLSGSGDVLLGFIAETSSARQGPLGYTPVWVDIQIIKTRMDLEKRLSLEREKHPVQRWREAEVCSAGRTRNDCHLYWNAVWN